MPGSNLNKIHESTPKNIETGENAHDVREGSRKDLTLSLNVDLHFDNEESKDRFIDQFAGIYWLNSVIKDFPRELQLAFAKKKPYLLESIEDPSEEFKLGVVKEKYRALQFILEPSEEMQVVGMLQSPDAINCIREEIISEKARQIYDVRMDWRNINTMKKPCKEASELAEKLKKLGIEKCDNERKATELAERLWIEEKKAEREKIKNKKA